MSHDLKPDKKKEEPRFPKERDGGESGSDKSTDPEKPLRQPAERRGPPKDQPEEIVRKDPDDQP